MISSVILRVCASVLLLWTLQSCNYHYYKGVKLEEKERHEEANIEYRQAYIESPNNSKFAEAFRRTAIKTSEDLLKRYERYLKEKKYSQAFRTLEQAAALTPDKPFIKTEAKKWFRTLLAGKIELADISSFLSSQIPLTEEISLEIHLNTHNSSRKLEAAIDYQTKIFKTEDVLYDPPPANLMSYSINSLGIKLVNYSTGQKRFKKLIDFKTPLLIGVQGSLKEDGRQLTPVENFSPPAPPENGEYGDESYRRAVGEKIIYSLTLDGDAIRADTSTRRMDFLPRIIYVNKKDRRYFLDFGQFELSRKKFGGFWNLRRVKSGRRSYLKDLQKYIILSPYFYFREGGYPIVPAYDNN